LPSQPSVPRIASSRTPFRTCFTSAPHWSSHFHLPEASLLQLVADEGLVRLGEVLVHLDARFLQGVEEGAALHGGGELGVLEHQAVEVGAHLLEVAGGL